MLLAGIILRIFEAINAIMNIRACVVAILAYIIIGILVKTSIVAVEAVIVFTGAAFILFEVGILVVEPI